MLASQYEITLPADYDMGVIRRRIAERGSALDDRTGLGLKAYLVRDIADGAPVNSYSPFYLWTDPAAFAAFHWQGEGFGGIVRDFGRPIVRTWIGGRFIRGSASAGAPTHAVRSTVVLGPDSDPAEEAERIDRMTRQLATDPHTHSAAWAIDPTRWEAVVFRLVVEGPADASGLVYRVHHLSQPEIAALH